jgi:hypothetical protein
MRLNKYLPFAILYFFLNTVGLPLGLTYTALLAPVFYIWIIVKRKRDIVLPFIGLLLPFIIAHLFIIKVDMPKYAIALINILAVYIFCQAFYTWLRSDGQKEKILYKLLLINTALCLVAVVFYFTPLNYIFWIQQDLTDNVDQFLRLKMFTYEASHYALVFTPVFLFYFTGYFLQLNTGKNRLLFVMLFLPYVLSFSMGVIFCLLAAGMLTFFIHFRLLSVKRRIVNGFISVGVLATVAVIAGFVFFRDNPVFIRIVNIFSGNDTSTTGRTGDAFILAGKLLKDNNPWWGIGPGQLTATGADMIRGYYLYHFTTPVAIPNAAAETLALFGWIGLAIRLLLEIVLFFITSVWKNYYRLLLFLFIFIYQFMGSYITNMAEYVIWILAFTNSFPQFNVSGKRIVVAESL